MSVFRVERTGDYTIMSNHHLRNKGISLKAKGLMSLMLSLPEEWDYTLKGLAYISMEKVDAIRTAIAELEKAGYIVRSRVRDDGGRLRGTEYIIYEKPVQTEEENEPESDSPTLEKPILENPTLVKPTQEKPTLENPTQLNTNKTNTEKSNTDFNNHSVNNDDEAEGEYSLDDILAKCHLDSFPEDERKVLYDAIERLFYSKSFRIGNAELPQEKVRSRLCELTPTVLENTMASLHQNTDKKVKNMTGYVMSTIFNCITEEYTVAHVDPFLNARRE